ncbi:uncharacterized protein TRIADDRAFT_53737 [Trichoplax adhaerens]|uniref:EGF-like domain-containing protein n=1 Tax=Trichoplax adhaerens TaxID=10228 RepID=B3RQ11_TRIAD|nr:predicted protein [Trichoplax adhaerens]EDV27740.1 predicted protein [Trichoplax adhaerens]|eukprot:XP_002109574.1 predicted protein [Trichoplax adhaerens]
MLVIQSTLYWQTVTPETSLVLEELESVEATGTSEISSSGLKSCHEPKLKQELTESVYYITENNLALFDLKTNYHRIFHSKLDVHHFYPNLSIVISSQLGNTPATQSASKLSTMVPGSIMATDSSLGTMAPSSPLAIDSSLGTMVSGFTMATNSSVGTIVPGSTMATNSSLVLNSSQETVLSSTVTKIPTPVQATNPPSVLTSSQETVLSSTVTEIPTPVQATNPPSVTTSMPISTTTMPPSGDLCVSRADCNDRGPCINITDINHKICRCEIGYFGNNCQFRDELALRKYFEDNNWRAVACIFIAISCILAVILAGLLIHSCRAKPQSASAEIELLTKKYRREAGLNDSHSNTHSRVRQSGTRQPNLHDEHDLGVSNPTYSGTAGHHHGNGNQHA